MPPDTARTQQAALERVQRLQAKEDKARKRYEQDKTKSDSTLKSLAAKAAKDGAAKKKLEELNGGKGDRKEGTPASGPVQGGKGMGPHKKNPVGDKSTKEAAKWTAKLAAASKKSQLPPDVPGANEAPQVATDGGKGAEGGGAGAAAGGGGGGGAAAGAAADGGAGGAGSTQKAKELTNAPPSEYAVKISETGKKITDEAKSEISTKNEAMPVFSAEMKGEDAKEKKGGKLNGLDASMGTGVDGADAAAPNLKKEARIRTGKGKPGSDIKGAGTDAETAALKSLFSASLNKISDQSSTNTSPGPSPTVQFGGKSDPMRGNRAQEEAIQKQDAAYVEAVKAVDSGPGPEQVQPLELKEDIPAANAELPPIPDVPTPAEAQAYIDKGHASDVYDKADELQKSNFDEALAEAESQFEQAGDQMNADHATKVDEASKAVDEENKKAQAEQEAQVTKARADIDKGQKDTKKKQEKELVKAKRKGDKEKKAVQGKIEKRRKDDDKKINKKYKEAEKKAAAKKKAAEKKKSDESWWSRAASAVGSFIDSVANAVSGIFDVMAKAVGDILNKVKDLATSMIDAAISFASSALDILGDKLKGLVDSLLGDIFPGLAAALNELIDQAVNIAKDAVNAVGEQLKAAVTAAIDTLNSGIQTAINAYKTAVTTALAIASAVASGDWEAAFKAMLEGALSLAGIDPSAFYGLVGDGMDTINAIIDDPMSFVSNMIGAVGQGFGQFADNFGSHLMNGAVEWLTGGLAEAGITLPETWDAAGIFGMIADILGVSFDKLKDKIGERIGEDNLAMLESIWGYVEAAMNGGIAGLWEHAKGQLGDLWAGLLDSAITMLTEQIITAAVMKIATMWNPAGAIVQALITVWNVYNFIQEQAQRIMGLVRSVVDSMSNIVQGQLGQAANFIEGSLADLVPVAISLLANLLGLGGISKKVKGIIEEIQAQVDKAIDWVLDKLFELGKAAFEALKSTMKGGGNEDPAAEQKAAEEQQPEQPKGGDPAKLPNATLATTIGATNLGWDAEKGGQGATSKLIGGTFAGKVAAESVGKLQAEAAKMEGPNKGKAESAIGTMRSQSMVVDSRGGKYIRGEESELGDIQKSFDLLASALLEAINAIGDETGGDKARSEADHAKMADSVESAMEAPVGGSLTYQQWYDALKARAEKQESTQEGNLEKDVGIDVTMAKSASAALSEGEFLIGIEIAPNDTTGDAKVELGSAGFDASATLTSEEFERAKEKFAPVAASIGLASSAAETTIKIVWTDTMELMNAQFPALEKSKLEAKDHRSGRADLEGETVKTIMKDLEPIADFVKDFMDKQAELHKGGNWAFWSGYPAMDVANANASMTLEKSALGAIFDGSKFDGAGRVELWATLSKAYATYAAKDFDKKKFMGFVGHPIERRSIFNQVEQPTFELLTKSETAKVDITWYACAGEPTGNGYYKYYPTETGGGLAGTFASGEGMGARASMVDKAKTYLKRISEGDDPQIAADPLKDKKDELIALNEAIKTGDPLSAAWVGQVKNAATRFDALAGPSSKMVTALSPLLKIDNVAENAEDALSGLKFDGLSDIAGLRSRVSAWKTQMPQWEGLAGPLANCRDLDKFSKQLVRMKAAIEACEIGLSMLDESNFLKPAPFAAKLEQVRSLLSGDAKYRASGIRGALSPVLTEVFKRSVTAVGDTAEFKAMKPGELGSTDGVWDNEAKVEELQSLIYSWKEFAGSTWQGRAARQHWNDQSDFLIKANTVAGMRSEFDTFFNTLPPDVKAANEALKPDSKNSIVKVAQTHFGSWVRLVNDLRSRVKDTYKTKKDLLAATREAVTNFFAGFGAVSAGGLSQLPVAIADQIWKDASEDGKTSPLAVVKGEQDQLMITGGHMVRMVGILTSAVPMLPLVGPAIAGIGRFFASWGAKNNWLRSLVDAAAEFVTLSAIQLATAGIGNIVLAVSAVFGKAGTIGGASTKALITEARTSLTKMTEWQKRFKNQKFEPPGVVTRLIEYLESQSAGEA